MLTHLSTRNLQLAVFQFSRIGKEDGNASTDVLAGILKGRAIEVENLLMTYLETGDKSAAAGSNRCQHIPVADSDFFEVQWRSRMKISNSVSQRDSLNATSTAGFWITVNQYAVQPNITSGSVESIWHAGQESCQHLIFFYSDNTVMRTTHTNIRLIGGSIWQHARIRCRDVSMGTENSGHSSIQVPAHCDLFRGCLRMHIYKNDLRLRLRQQAIGGAEGAIVLHHEYSTLQVHDGDRKSVV